jgi:hypothetical protein
MRGKSIPQSGVFSVSPGNCPPGKVPPGVNLVSGGPDTSGGAGNRGLFSKPIPETQDLFVSFHISRRPGPQDSLIKCRSAAVRGSKNLSGVLGMPKRSFRRGVKLPKADLGQEDFGFYENPAVFKTPCGKFY